MMLDYLGEPEAAKRIEASIMKLVQDRTIHSFDTDSGLGTDQVGDMVVEEVLSRA